MASEAAEAAYPYRGELLHDLDRAGRQTAFDEGAIDALESAAKHVDGFADRLRDRDDSFDKGAQHRSRAYSQAAGFLRREAAARRKQLP